MSASNLAGRDRPDYEVVSNTDVTHPPDSAEVEISLFGPGFGECVVIHTGQNEWIIVDSCLSDDGKPAALEYLSKLGVNCARDVSHVVVSHGDNDHIGGAAELFAACASATLVLSTALTEREVLAWVAAYSEVDPSSLSRATTELASIIEQSAPRRKRFAVQDLPINVAGHYKLHALSPNHERIKGFLATMATKHPTAGTPRQRVGELTPNAASVVLLLETPVCNAILGADLEEAPSGAWTHLITDSVAYRDAQPSILLKIPHHGSPNADCEALWARLAKPSIAITTTFNRGATKRPSQEDVNRILSRTQNAFCCSAFSRITAVRDHDVDKVLKRLHVVRRRRFPKLGQVRVRFKAGCQPRIELFGAATHLSDVHKAA